MESPTIPDVPPQIILMVDDEPENLEILGRLLDPPYKVLAAQSGPQALEIAAGALGPDLILLDVMMPGMDGYAVLAHLKEHPATCGIPVIFVTGLDAAEDEAHGLGLGAVDYIPKPYRPSIILARVRTHLELKHARDRLQGQNAYLAAEVDRRVQDILLVQDITINVLAELAETRDPETGNHIRRTREYVRILAQRLKPHPRFSAFLSDKVVDQLAKSASLHDIGKVGIPDHILLKPGGLTAGEWEIMKTHTLLGSQAIGRALRWVDRRIDFLDMAMQIARSHHEKWDGSGYPEGLKGEAIPIPARLMAFADAFDARTSHRSYKPSMEAEEAREILLGDRGRHFDPDVVDAFLLSFDEFVAVSGRYQDHGGDGPGGNRLAVSRSG